MSKKLNIEVMLLVREIDKLRKKINLTRQLCEQNEQDISKRVLSILNSNN